MGTTSCRALESLYLLAVKIASITPCTLKGQELKKRAVLGDLGALPQWSGRGDRPDVVQTFEHLLQTSPADTFAASTSLCITNDGRWRFSVVDALVTNFHHPDSTLLHLVDAFLAGKARDVYRRALSGNYRFLSYGDACYLTRSMDERATVVAPIGGCCDGRRRPRDGQGGRQQRDNDAGGRNDRRSSSTAAARPARGP